jgi:hypothetical protein
MACDLGNAVERTMFCEDFGPAHRPELMSVNVEDNHVARHFGDRSQRDDHVVGESQQSGPHDERVHQIVARQESDDVTEISVVGADDAGIASDLDLIDVSPAGAQVFFRVEIGVDSEWPTQDGSKSQVMACRFLGSFDAKKISGKFLLELQSVWAVQLDSDAACHLRRQPERNNTCLLEISVGRDHKMGHRLLVRIHDDVGQRTKTSVGRLNIRTISQEHVRPSDIQ